MIPRKLPEIFNLRVPVSTAVASLATENNTITASGHAHQCAFFVVSATATAVAEKATTWSIAKRRGGCRGTRVPSLAVLPAIVR
jgi:hypothetical protein